MVIQVACVCVGDKYGREYVERLRQGVHKNLREQHKFVVLTDNPRLFYPTETIDVSGTNLPGWWSKMLLFNTAVRETHPTIFIDLDNVIVGNLAPLAEIAKTHPFTMCENFTQIEQRTRGGMVSWPCRYSSTVMTFGPGFNLDDIWTEFWDKHNAYMQEFARTGDQKVVEHLLGSREVPYLQNLLPEGFFVHYRHMREQQPEAAAIAVFGGSKKPHNSNVPWVKEKWK